MRAIQRRNLRDSKIRSLEIVVISFLSPIGFFRLRIGLVDCGSSIHDARGITTRWRVGLWILESDSVDRPTLVAFKICLVILFFSRSNEVRFLSTLASRHWERLKRNSMLI